MWPVLAVNWIVGRALPQEARTARACGCLALTFHHGLQERPIPILGYNGAPQYLDIPIPDYTYYGHEHSWFVGESRSSAQPLTVHKVQFVLTVMMYHNLWSRGCSCDMRKHRSNWGVILHARVRAKHTKCSRHILHRRTTEQHFCTRTACTLYRIQTLPYINLSSFSFSARYSETYNCAQCNDADGEAIAGQREIFKVHHRKYGREAFPMHGLSALCLESGTCSSPGLLHPRDVMHGHVNLSPGCRPGADGLLRGLIRKHLTDASSSAP